MFALARMLFFSCFTGLVTSLLVVGAVGLWTGVPLAFLEILPGDQMTELRQLPRTLVLSAFSGFAIGSLGGLATQMTGQRINYAISILLIGLCAVLTIRWTHPGINLTLESGWLDYLESYRLTVLAVLGSTIGVVLLGWVMKPFRRERSAAGKHSR